MASSDSKLIKAEKKWVKTELQEVCVCFTFRSEKKVDNAICADFLAPFPAIYCSATHFYCKQCSAKLQNETICGVLDTAHILLLQ